MDPYTSDPRLARAAKRPRPGCGEPATAGTAAVSICGRGHEWKIEPVEVPDPVALDHLGGAALTVGRLRAFMDAPATGAERPAARRFLDRRNGDRR